MTFDEYSKAVNIRFSIDALTDQHSGIDSQITTLRQEQLQICETIHTLQRQQKPEFPTDDHLEGLKEAVVRLRTKEPSKSHHGDPCGPENDRYVVVCDPSSGFVLLRDGAPYLFQGVGKAWAFTQADIEAFTKLLEQEGFRVVDHWLNDVGVSFRVRSAS